MKREIQFLLDRLEEYDPEDEDHVRDFHGHVAPAIARLRSAMAPPKVECEYCEKWHDPRVACPEYAALSRSNLDRTVIAHQEQTAPKSD